MFADFEVREMDSSHRCDCHLHTGKHPDRIPSPKMVISAEDSFNIKAMPLG